MHDRRVREGSSLLYDPDNSASPIQCLNKFLNFIYLFIPIKKSQDRHILIKNDDHDSIGFGSDHNFTTVEMSFLSNSGHFEVVEVPRGL